MDDKDAIKVLKVSNFLQYKGAEHPTKEEMKVWSKAMKQHLKKLFSSDAAIEELKKLK